MAGIKFGSRKLLVILAFLLLSSHSITYSKLPLGPEVIAGSHGSVPAPIDNGDVVMLVDTNTGQCLGNHGDFGECGELSLWHWTKKGSNVKLQSITAIHEDEEYVPTVSGECLGRRRALVGSADLKMLPCNAGKFAPTEWTYDEQSGKLMDAGLTSKFIGKSCVNNGKNILQNCKSGFTALKKVLFHPNAHNAASPLAGVQSTTATSPSTSQTTLLDTGSWKCPVTGQVFPRNLDQHLSAPRALAVPVDSIATSPLSHAVAGTRGGSSTGPSSASVSSTAATQGGRQVFMGGGVFSKVFMGMTFNVYSMGWYVEAEAAQQDPSLRAYRNKALPELQANQAFYEQLASAGSYDRTLFVKLAMTLKTKMLLEGFLSEIVLQPQNKAAVAAASSAYTVPVCPEGLEIIFTWRVPKANAPAGQREYLEVRIGDMYFELHEPGLAEDFMRQFFAPENPVSPAAKKGFATFFPSLLAERSYSPSFATGTAAAAATAGAGSQSTGLSSTSSGARRESRVQAGIFGLRGWKAAA